MTFFCVVENVGGGVRSHPAVINLLAVRNSEILVEMWGRTMKRSLRKRAVRERRMERASGWEGRMREIGGEEIKHSPLSLSRYKPQTCGNIEAEVLLKCHRSRQLECRQGRSWKSPGLPGHFKALPRSQSSSALRGCPCCRPYRGQMRLIYEQNFISRGVHHMLFSAVLRGAVFHQMFRSYPLFFSNSTSYYLCLTTRISHRVTAKHFYNTDCLFYCYLVSYSPQLQPPQMTKVVTALLKSVTARAHTDKSVSKCQFPNCPKESVFVCSIVYCF